jgi:hypothetical protein
MAYARLCSSNIARGQGTESTRYARYDVKVHGQRATPGNEPIMEGAVYVKVTLELHNDALMGLDACVRTGIVQLEDSVFSPDHEKAGGCKA